MRPGEYTEFGVPGYILKELPDNISVRMFATPSETNPNEGYYLQAIKGKRAGWGNGTATVMCSCLSSMFKAVLVLTGIKAPCKHARGLRVLLSSRMPAWTKFPRGEK